MTYRIGAVAAALLFAGAAPAWHGLEAESGSYVKVEDWDPVSPGDPVGYYDYVTGDYRHGTIQSIYSDDWVTEMEIYDYESGTIRRIRIER